MRQNLFMNTEFKEYNNPHYKTINNKIENKDDNP